MKEKGLEIKSMYIKYVFTEDEKKEVAGKLATKISEKQALEDKKKEVASQLTAEINKANAATSQLSREYNQGYTWKNHDCYEIFDYGEKVVHTHRADTDENVDTRTMTTSEYQKEMFSPREEINEEPQLLDDPEESENQMNDDDPDNSVAEDEELETEGVS